MNSEYKSALFLSIKIGYLSSFQKQAANSLVTETLQYFVFFCRPAYSAILVKCLIINVLRFILAIPFFTAFLNITYTAQHQFYVHKEKVSATNHQWQPPTIFLPDRHLVYRIVYSCHPQPKQQGKGQHTFPYQFYCKMIKAKRRNNHIWEILRREINLLI